MFTTLALLVFALRIALLLEMELMLPRLLLLFPWLLLLSPLIALFKPSPLNWQSFIIIKFYPWSRPLDWYSFKVEGYPLSTPLVQEASYWQCFCHLSGHFHQKALHRSFFRRCARLSVSWGNLAEIVGQGQNDDLPEIVISGWFEGICDFQLCHIITLACESAVEENVMMPTQWNRANGRTSL